MTDDEGQDMPEGGVTSICYGHVGTTLAVEVRCPACGDKHLYPAEELLAISVPTPLGHAVPVDCEGRRFAFFLSEEDRREMRELIAAATIRDAPAGEHPTACHD